MKNIDTVIFDMDGVIIDSEPVNMEIIDNIYEELNIVVPEDIRLKTIGAVAKEWWSFIVENFNITNHTGEELAELEIEREFNYFSDPGTDKHFFENIEDILKILKEKGYKLGLASSSHMKTINSVLSTKNLEKYFDVVVSGTNPDIKEGKPSPDIFLYTAQQLDSNPQNCLVIEDSENGLKAAKSANMTSCAFLSSPISINLENADYKISNYGEFFNELKL